MYKVRQRVSGIFLITLFIFSATLVIAATPDNSVTFSWLPNPESEQVTGYRIHYGTTAGGPYPETFDAGKPAPINGRIQATVYNLTPGKTYYFTATAYNAKGREGIPSKEVSYTVPEPEDVTPPTGSININQGAASTTNSNVTLYLSAKDDEDLVAQMKFSNNNTDWSQPESFKPNKTWTLSDGIGTKTVYARFSDQAGNWSETVSDSIELKPKPDVTPPVGSIVINRNAASTTESTVTLSLTAQDNQGSVALMKFSNDNHNWSQPEKYQNSKSWKLSDGTGTKTVYARFSDPAGNWSETVSDSIELKSVSTPPTTPAPPQKLSPPKLRIKSTTRSEN